MTSILEQVSLIPCDIDCTYVKEKGIFITQTITSDAGGR